MKFLEKSSQHVKTAIVFESIKENMQDKPVLVIGHQIVQGIFDKMCL